MKNKTLHIMIAERKFTIPLVNSMIKDSSFENHFYLFFAIGNENVIPKKNTFVLTTSFSKENIKNFFIIVYQLLIANKIVLHGLIGLKIIKYMPWKWKSVSWVIHGADLYNRIGKKEKSFLLKSFFRNISSHITHIEGDSVLANQHFNSNIRFHYSPMYLSNVVDVNNFSFNIDKKADFVLLVGNSLSKNNNHLEVFVKLLPFKHLIKEIICPLSYGNDMSYQEEVIKKGTELFGSKFNPLTDFMEPKEYELLLQKVDIALFDHWRQEAMGVTLTLLSQGKTVYMRSTTESYKSLKERGFIVFSNEVLFLNGPQVFDTSTNKMLLEKYYTKDVLKKSLLSI